VVKRTHSYSDQDAIVGLSWSNDVAL
jgi:hypothetical protein